MVGLSAEIIGAFRLWHFLIVVGVVSFLLGVVGEWQGMFKIEEDFRIIAIMGGFFFSGYAGVMAWLKPLERNGKSAKIPITRIQARFCAQFTDWLPIDDAKGMSKVEGFSNRELYEDEGVLRAEVGVNQKLLDRKIKGGIHLVKFHRGNDETEYVSAS